MKILHNARDRDLLRLDVGNGQFTVVIPPEGGINILQRGDLWIENAPGVHCLTTMALELEELRQRTSDLEEENECLRDQLARAVAMEAQKTSPPF